MPYLDELLAKSTWADALTGRQLAQVQSDIVVASVLRGNFICRKGEPAKHWIGVMNGLVKLANVHASGKTTTYIAVPTSGWFGEGSLQRNVPRSYDAIALRDTQIAYMPRSTFLWLQENSVEFNRFVLRLLAERLFQFFGLLEYSRVLHSANRVAQCLATMFNPTLHPAIDSRFTIGQEEIGNLVGLSRQRVNHALRILQHTGLVKIAYRSITVIDVNGLRNFEEIGRNLQAGATPMQTSTRPQLA